MASRMTATAREIERTAPGASAGPYTIDAAVGTRSAMHDMKSREQ